MTRDEAIKVLNMVESHGLADLAKRRAIKALEQECVGSTQKHVGNTLEMRCDDAISRQAALKLFATHDGKYLFEAIRDLPSVTPIPCSDAISRQAVMRVLDEIGSDFDSPRNAVVSLDGIADAVQGLPSVTPQEPKTGRWILDETDNSITCDKCGCLIWANDISNGDAHYCPNCGARMESEE